MSVGKPLALISAVALVEIREQSLGGRPPGGFDNLEVTIAGARDYCRRRIRPSRSKRSASLLAVPR